MVEERAESLKKSATDEECERVAVRRASGKSGFSYISYLRYLEAKRSHSQRLTLLTESGIYCGNAFENHYEGNLNQECG